MRAVVPFPFGALDALSAREAAATSRLRSVARGHVRLDAVAAALGELAGERVDVFVRKVKGADPPRGIDDMVGVMLAPAESARTSSQRALVELEGALAAALAARALRGRAPRVIDASRPAPPELAGAVAAVLATALRRAHAGRPLRVVAAGPGAALARDLVAAERDVTTAWLTVTLGPDAYDARVSVPDAAVASPAPESFGPEALAALGDAPLALPLLAASCLALRRDLRALAPGDAFLPGAFPLRDAGGELVGPVALVAPRAERGLAADLAEGGRLVLRGLVESHPWDRPAEPIPMSAEPSSNATLEVLEDAPVVVRVELGAVELTARHWANLGAGDVVSLGRKVGEPAILRVGGVEVARGELVLVDGEYAVRILARPGGAP